MKISYLVTPFVAIILPIPSFQQHQKQQKQHLRVTNTNHGEEFLLKSTMTTPTTVTSFSKQPYRSYAKADGDDLLEQHGPIPTGGNGDDSISENRKRSDHHSHDHSDLTFGDNVGAAGGNPPHHNADVDADSVTMLARSSSTIGSTSGEVDSVKQQSTMVLKVRTKPK